MTLTPVAPPTVTPIDLSGYPSSHRGFTGVASFTYDSAMTYTELVDSIRRWIPQVLIPWIGDNFEGFEQAWADEADALEAYITSALAAQNTAVNAAIAKGVQDFANANVDVTDPKMKAAVSTIGSQTRTYLDSLYGTNALTDAGVKSILAAGTSTSRDYLDSRYTVLAPAPSGDATGTTDQAALQAILDAGKNLLLQAGHYYVKGLTTPNTPLQPRVVGVGKMLTVLEAVGTSVGWVLRFGSTSGGISGGAFENLTIKGTNIIGVKIAGACGIKWRQVLFDGALNDCIQLYNDQNGYTEFCNGEAEFTTNTIGPALHYSVSATGNKSFHNSGLTEGSLINQRYGATQPSILVDQGALPYNAPMTVQIFARTPTMPLFRNLNTVDTVNFRGGLTVEQFVDGCVVVDTVNAPIYHSGSFNAYGHLGLIVGALRLVDAIWTPQPGTAPVFHRRKWSGSRSLAAGATNVVSLDVRSSYQVSVRILDGAGYEYDQLLYVVLRPNVGDGSGFVSVLATPRNADSGAKGAPVWSVSNNNLSVTNPNFTSAMVATYSVTPLTPWVPLY